MKNMQKICKLQFNILQHMLQICQEPKWGFQTPFSSSLWSVKSKVYENYFEAVCARVDSKIWDRFMFYI